MEAHVADLAKPFFPVALRLKSFVVPLEGSGALRFLPFVDSLSTAHVVNEQAGKLQRTPALVQELLLSL